LNLIERSWDGWHWITFVLLPLTGLFCLLAWLRRQAYRIGWLKSHRLDVPVIVVGNISVGGTGKTPLIIWLARWLAEAGYRPGIILRGYGGSTGETPTEVTASSLPREVGDEAVLIRRHSSCPVFVGSRRAEVGRRLLAEHACDLILSDDGLQHYALQRDMEIVVIDGQRRFGNGLCLPAGPLRESSRRLSRSDLVVVNGEAEPGEYSLQLITEKAISLQDGRQLPLQAFQGHRVYAIAGIGHPERFFRVLNRAGLETVCHAFPDHHPYTEKDLAAFRGETVLMTEKDGVKCEQFALPGLWYVPATAEPDAGFRQVFESKLKRLTDG
jgi:tetraacyldisaccharide 4'-kinase